MMFVYIITCSETLKIYVGQHQGSDLGKYLSRKFYDAHRAYRGYSILYNAMRKYPRESWSIHVLVADVATRAELDDLEKHFIRVLKTQHPDVGYNICAGGEGRRGPHTEEWRKETLARVNEYWANPESRTLRSQQMAKQWEDPEFRQKMRILSSERTYPNRVLTEEHKQKISLGMQGKQNTIGHI